MSETKPEDEQCPVCGYYCLGNGGIGCIDKPTYVKNYYKVREEPADQPSIPISKIEELIKIRKVTIHVYYDPAYYKCANEDFLEDLQKLIDEAKQDG